MSIGSTKKPIRTLGDPMKNPDYFLFLSWCAETGHGNLDYLVDMFGPHTILGWCGLPVPTIGELSGRTVAQYIVDKGFDFYFIAKHYAGELVDALDINEHKVRAAILDRTNMDDFLTERAMEEARMDFEDRKLDQAHA